MAHLDPSEQMISKGWNHTPDAPVALSPLFAWPPRPGAMLRWVAASWSILTCRLLILGLSVASWYLTQPALERCREFRLDWIAQIWGRNLAMMILVAGGLHLFFVTLKRQKSDLKFDPREMEQGSGTFLFGHQVYDNMFWTLASGVTVWTGVEVITMWGYANGFWPTITWEQNPIWFVLLFLLLPIWGSFHFYWIHRALHWPPLYRLAHSLHHRNVNIGPWSGMSMHPVEHLFYLSTGLIHWIIASHPIHFLYHMQLKALEAATSHTGFERLLVRDRNSVVLGDFFHQLHHRYFECNYGTLEMPWDRWFGSFHDGTERAATEVRARRKRLSGG